MKLILGTHPLPTLNFFFRNFKSKTMFKLFKISLKLRVYSCINANIIRTTGHLLHFTSHIEYKLLKMPVFIAQMLIDKISFLKHL